VNGYLRLWLACPLLSACCCWWRYLCSSLGVSLALTWPSRLCLLRVLCTMPLVQAFPFPSTLGEVTLHPLSQACVFIYSSHGKWVFCPLLWSFPPSATLTSFPTPGFWVLLPSPARPGLFIYSSRRDSPPPLWRSGPTLFPVCLYCSYCLSLSFSFFSGWGSVCPGGTLIWPRVVCGSTMYHLAHLVCVFPSCLDAGNWRQPGGPPGFPVQCEVRGSAQAGGVEGSKFCLLSVALPARCVSSISPRFHFRRYAFCFLPQAAILEIPQGTAS
jgi:hypothetical protein